MDENKFWLSVWSIVGTVVATLILSMAGYNAHSNIVIERMVEKHGVDPMRASCAVEFNRGAVCSILAAKP